MTATATASTGPRQGVDWTSCMSKLEETSIASRPPNGAETLTLLIMMHLAAADTDRGDQIQHQNAKGSA